MKAFAVQTFTGPVVPVDQTDLIPVGSEIVVEVLRCGICHTDLHLQDGYYDLGGGKRANLPDRGINPPLIMGHEVLGRVIAIGPDSNLSVDQIGKAFLVYPWLGCGTCDICVAGSENLCAKPRYLGVARPGGYAEQCLVPDAKYLIDVTGIEPALAATYACSGLTAYSALSKVHIDKEHDLLLIMGFGGVGLSGFQIARALGFQRIAVADIDPAKLSLASSAGAELVIDPRDTEAFKILAAAGGVSAAVDFVGNSGTAELGVAALRKGGCYVLVGLFGGEITLSLPPIAQRSIAIQGSFVGNLAELQELVDLAKSGAIERLPVEPIPFSEINDALGRLRRGEVHGRLVLSR